MDYTKARNRALYLLMRMQYHSAVLKQKLLDKGCSEKIADQVIAACEKMGLINDEEAILMQLRRGNGPYVIAYKWRISLDEVKEVITDEMQKEKIRQIQKRYPDSAKGFKAAMRKGFDYSLVSEVFHTR